MGDYNVMLLRIQNSKDEEIRDGFYEISIKNFSVYEYSWQFYFSTFLENIFDECDLKFNKLVDFYQDKLKYFSVIDYKFFLIKNAPHWAEFTDIMPRIWEISYLRKLNWFYESILVDVDFNTNTVYLARRIPDCIVPIPPISNFISKGLLKNNKFYISIDYTHFTNNIKSIDFINDSNDIIDFNKINIREDNNIEYFDYDMIDSSFEDFMNGDKTFLYDIKQHSRILSNNLKLYLEKEQSNEIEFYRQLGFYIRSIPSMSNDSFSNKLPSAWRCRECGQWLQPCDDDFIEVFEDESSIENKDFIIHYGICEDCQWWEELDERKRFEEMKNNYDFDYGDWKY